MTLVLPDPERLARDMAKAVHVASDSTERSQQAAKGIVGISDIGVCREQVRRMVVEEAPSDEPENYKAFIGTELGDGIELAVIKMYPTAQRHLEVMVTLPSGVQIPGHPDLVLATGVIDIKTVDGLTAVRRQGPSVAQQFQRHLYAGALIQMGILPEECWVGNAWWDRSGRESIPHVQLEAYDPVWLDFADAWLDDVTYAVRNHEEAQKDQPIEWCQVACPFFASCRGEDVMKDHDGGGLIEDPQLVDAVEAYKMARDMKKEAERMMDDARRELAGTSGTTGEDVVRWTHVSSTDVAGFTRAPYDKLEIRKIPRARSKK